MEKIKYKSSINKDRVTDTGIADGLRSVTLKNECADGTIKSSVSRFGSMNPDAVNGQSDGGPVIPEADTIAHRDAHVNGAGIRENEYEPLEAGDGSGFGERNTAENIRENAHNGKTHVTDGKYGYTATGKNSGRYFDGRNDKGIRKYTDVSGGMQSGSEKPIMRTAVPEKREGRNSSKHAGTGREPQKKTSVAAHAGDDGKNRTSLTGGTRVISRGNGRFMRDLVRLGEMESPAFGDAGDGASDAPRIHSIKTDVIRKSMEGPLNTVMVFAKGLFCKLLPGHFILKTVTISAAALILAFILILVAIFEASPIGRIIAFKNNIVGFFSENGSEDIIRTAEQALDNKYEVFETNAGIREKEYVMAEDSDYDSFRDSSGRVSNYGSVLGLYYCLLYDKTAGNGTDYETVDGELMDRAFNELTYSSSVKDETVISPVSPKEMLKLGRYPIVFMEDAAASEIAVYLPDEFYSTYSFSKGSASDLLVDIVSADDKYPFKLQKCGIKKEKGTESGIAVVYPAHMKEDIYNSIFPGRTDGMWTVRSGPELWFNKCSNCELKKTGKDIVTITLKSFKSDYAFINESTYYMAKAVLSELGELPAEGNAGQDNVTDERIKKVIDYAFTKKGHPYSQALRNDGYHYDCSSFVYACYLNGCGLKIEHGGNTAAAEAMYCTVNKKEVGRTYKSDILKPGDLIFYSMNANGRYLNITHVALYCGNNMVIDASYSMGKVVYRKIYSTDKIVLIGRPL